MNILITNSFHPQSIAKLASKFNVVQTSQTEIPTPEIENAHGLLIRSKTTIDADFLSKAVNLKFIATATSGLDHIDLELCKQKDITVFNPKEVNSISAAEHCFAILLSVTKKLKTANAAIHKNNWKDSLSRGSDLYGKTIGIIGFGRVGSKVAKMAKAFNMNTQGYDPYKDTDYFNTHQTKKIEDLEQLIESSDIITIHTPLTDETKYILNKNNLKFVKKNAFLINTSRGKCINENDLIKLLKAQAIKAAALDVFETEPIKADNPLIGLDNTFLTPHIGAYTEESFISASFECTKWLYDKLIQLK